VDERVGGDGFAAVDIEWRTIEARHRASGLLHQQDSGAGIPRIQVELPETVVAARGHIGQIERSRTGAADAMRAQGDLVVEVNVGTLVALETRKAGAENGLSQRRGGGNIDRPGIEGRATSLGGGEQLVARRIVENASDDFPLVLQSQGNAEDRISVGEIGRAIERIDIPAVGATVGVARTLFADDVVIGPGGAQAGDDEPLTGAVSLGHQIDVPLVLKADAAQEKRHQKFAGFRGDGRGLG